MLIRPASEYRRTLNEGIMRMERERVSGKVTGSNLKHRKIRENGERRDQAGASQIQYIMNEMAFKFATQRQRNE